MNDDATFCAPQCVQVAALSENIGTKLATMSRQLDYIAQERLALASVLENYAEAGRQLLELKSLIERMLDLELENGERISRHDRRLEILEHEMALVKLRTKRKRPLAKSKPRG